MDICIYGKYRVKCVNRYDYYTGPDWNELQYARETERFTKTESGHDVIERIKRELNSPYILSIDFTGDKIHFDLFNPSDGTGQDIVYTITEIKERENGNGTRKKNTRKVIKNNP